MVTVYIILAILFVGAVLFFLSLVGRGNNPGLKAFRGHAYAHRGLHGKGIPENSMAAFKAAFDHGYGIELDIHLIKDGNLAVIHDTSLKRTTGSDVSLTELTTAQLSNYKLEGSGESIPTFSQVLELYAGKYPLIIELKADGNNQRQLVAAAVKAMEGYSGEYCMESFDPRCVYWLKKHRPDLIRGQLSEDFVHNPKNPLPMHMKFLLTHLLENFLTRPDFVAYRFKDRKSLSPFLARKVWGAQGVTWTITRKEDLETAHKEGWLPIFEGFRP
jgi:glycerophosphoryl diester phosphodiesterase